MISDGMYSIIAILAIKSIMMLIIGNQKTIIVARFMTIEMVHLVAHKLALGNPKVHLT
jgi:hypothetical protein